MPLCGRCNKPVYTAEEQLGAGKSWHRGSCYTCATCGSGLASTTLAENNGEIYCKSCHSKHFGPKGYGYGGGAGTLSMDAGRDAYGRPQVPKSTAPATGLKGSKFGGADKCPRCGKSVYAAEKMIGAGQSWHKGCFSCKLCSKRLDSTTMRDNAGEIYCDPCHRQQFGPKGFGYGIGAGALSHTQ